MEVLKMVTNENTGQDAYQPDASTTFRLVSEAGDRLTVAISPTGFAVIRAEVLDENAVLGSLVVTGLTPEQVAKKSKGFWGKLWDKIKGAAKAVIDFVTFDVGPVTCRPDGSVNYHNGQVTSWRVGVSCSGKN
jgi:hypothetical protein